MGGVVDQARAASLRLVRFLYCDNDGVVRGKASGMAGLAHRLQAGIGLTVATQAFSMLDRLAPVEGMGPVGEVRLVPDPDTFVVAPYAPHTGVLVCDLVGQDRRPYAADPRDFLRRMIERAEGHGLRIMAAFEPEWTLLRADGDGWVPIDRSLCFSSDGMGSAAEVIDELVGALEAQGMTVEQYYPELGWGQQELSIAHAAALRAADNQLLYRETVRSVAQHHGRRASFAPKPFADQAGNGCHLHFSGWNLDGSGNRFSDPGRAHGLSELAVHFVAGVLDHLPALLALTCASVNSYRRLQPQAWASAYRAWGLDNREAALRVPSIFWGQRADSTNVELKACDSSCNPYMALGGLIAAGLDGVERRLDPPPPLTVDPHTLTPEERSRLGVTPHPGSLSEALRALSDDEVLMAALGARLAESYLAVKGLNVQAFASEGDSFELSQHLLKF